MNKKFTSFHVGVAAEAIAAAQFARCGFDVSVQYGANQPGYDLIVVKGKRILKVSVKGSQNGAWGLCQSHLTEDNWTYHEAINQWRKCHDSSMAFCFVQFEGVCVDGMPRVYLATPKEVATRLHQTKKGKGDTVLHENKVWTNRAIARGTVDAIPDRWKFSEKRIEELLKAIP